MNFDEEREDTQGCHPSLRSVFRVPGDSVWHTKY